MKHRKRASTRAAVSLLALLVATGAASAETIFTATMDGSQQVPPTESGATGYAVLILNDEETEVAYAITFTGLEGVEVGSHFHQALPGENGPSFISLPFGSPKIGVWPLSAHDVGDLRGGRVYVNIHTTLYPSGEIRGDISESTASAEEDPQALSWSRIKALYS
jgi:hypothetical protein